MSKLTSQSIEVGQWSNGVTAIETYQFADGRLKWRGKMEMLKRTRITIFKKL